MKPLACECEQGSVKMEKKNMMKHKKLLPKLKSRMGKLGASLLIFLMAASDFYTVRGLFIDVNVNWFDALVFALISAIILEMLPSYMGLVLGKRLDKARYQKNLSGWPSVIIAFLVTTALIVFLAFLRYKWVEVGWAMAIAWLAWTDNKSRMRGAYVLSCTIETRAITHHSPRAATQCATDEIRKATEAQERDLWQPPIY